MSNPQSVPTTVFYPERDKYGRSCHRLTAFPAYRTLGYVVRLPKAAIENRTDGAKYFVNDWTDDRHPSEKLTHHATLKAAKAALLASVSA